MEKSKLEKYREERARHLEKIADLQKRVRALDQRIMENESMEIRALMRSENVTLEELKTFARITGHEDVHGLCVEDLCTVSREISEFTDIPHA